MPVAVAEEQCVVHVTALLEPDRVVAEAAGVAPFSVPQIVLAGDSLLLAWTDSSGEDSFVKTALVPLHFLD